MRLGQIHHDPSAVRCGTAPGAARWGASPHAYPMNEGSAQVLACSLNHAVGKAGGAKAKNRNHFAKLGRWAFSIPSAALARKPADGWPLHEGGTQTRSRQLRQKVRELGKCPNSRRGWVFLFSSMLSLLYPRIRRVRGRTAVDPQERGRVRFRGTRTRYWSDIFLGSDHPWSGGSPCRTDPESLERVDPVRSARPRNRSRE